jgi:VWFA-related protein
MKAHAPALILAVALALPLVSEPQKRALIPSLGETIDINIVDLDVVVTTRDGRRVHGLTREDFTVTENGQRREISNFAEYASGDAAGSAPAQPRTVLVFIERTRLAPHDAERLTTGIRDMLRNTIRHGDAVGLVFWHQARHARIDFTADLERIDQALIAVKRELIAAGRTGTANDVSVTREAQESQDLENRSAAMEDRDLGGSSPDVTNWSAVIERVGNIDSLSELSRMKRRVHAINSAISSMGAVEGKKVLLLATERLGEVVGGDYEYDPSTDILAVDVRQRFATSDLIDSVIRNANAAGVTIYAGFLSEREGRSSSEEVEKIAWHTGGLNAAGTGGFVELLQRVEDDVADYYSLAYRTNATGQDRKRNIVLKTRDPRLLVRVRRSYVEKSDRTRMRDRLMAALVRSTSDSMFRIQAELGRSRSQRRSIETMPLQVRIPIEALTVVPENGARVGAFSVYVLASSGGDEMSALSSETRRFEIQPAHTTSGHFTYDFDLLINRRADRLAVGVLDELSKSFAVLRLPIPGR